MKAKILVMLAVLVVVFAASAAAQFPAGLLYKKPKPAEPDQQAGKVRWAYLNERLDKLEKETIALRLRVAAIEEPVE